MKDLTKTLRNYVSVGTLSPGSLDIFVKGDMIKYKSKQKRSLSTFKTVPKEASSSETRSRGELKVKFQPLQTDHCKLTHSCVHVEFADRPRLGSTRVRRIG